MKKILSILILPLLFSLCASCAGDADGPAPSSSGEAAGQNPPVPEGFVHVEGQWNTGFVVEDPAGNQFVWIPVDGTAVSLGRYSFVDNEATGNSYLEQLKDDNMQGYQESLPDDFAQSVEQYGGYYVGRYESALANGTLQIQKGLIPASGLTQGEMETACAELGGQYTKAATSLMNSFAWDTMLLCITYYHSDPGNFVTSGHLGNHTDTLLPSGSFDNDEAFHIADLCGNLFERTTEHDGNGAPVDRGGCYGDGSVYFAGARSVYPDSETDAWTGFRVLLYLE